MDEKVQLNPIKSKLDQLLYPLEEGVNPLEESKQNPEPQEYQKNLILNNNLNIKEESKNQRQNKKLTKSKKKIIINQTNR